MLLRTHTPLKPVCWSLTQTIHFVFEKLDVCSSSRQHHYGATKVVPSSLVGTQLRQLDALRFSGERIARWGSVLMCKEVFSYPPRAYTQYLRVVNTINGMSFCLAQSHLLCIRENPTAYTAPKADIHRFPSDLSNLRALQRKMISKMKNVFCALFQS